MRLQSLVKQIMEIIKLIVKKCAVTGDLGLVPESSLSFYNASEYYIAGSNVGHELIDHTPNETGTLEEELLALGCLIYRQNWNYRRGLALDLQASFRDAARPAYDCPQTVENYLVADMIDGIWEGLEQSLANYPDDFGYFEDGAEIPALDELWNRQNLTAWLALGYDNAKKRHNDYDICELNAIVTAINDACAKGSRSIEFDGQEFLLSYDINNAWAQVAEVEPKYDVDDEED